REKCPSCAINCSAERTRMPLKSKVVVPVGGDATDLARERVAAYAGVAAATAPRTMTTTTATKPAAENRPSCLFIACSCRSGRLPAAARARDRQCAAKPGADA